MEKIFLDAKDKNVAKVLVYVDSNGYAFSDSAKTIYMTAEQLWDAYLKGCVIVGEYNYYTPIIANSYNGTMLYYFDNNEGELLSVVNVDRN